MQHLAHSPHRLRRLALLGVLVLVLRFAGAELHEAFDAHEPGESCAYCLVLERGGHALPPADVLAQALPLPAATLVEPASIVVPAACPAPLPRGPPLLSA